MRNLLLLRGIPASGKSTLIKNSGLRQECLSTDVLRDMYSSIVQKNRWKLWENQQARPTCV